MKINKRKLLGWILVSPVLIIIIGIYFFVICHDYRIAIAGLIAFGIFLVAMKGSFILAEESGKKVFDKAVK